MAPLAPSVLRDVAGAIARDMGTDTDMLTFDGDLAAAHQVGFVPH